MATLIPPNNSCRSSMTAGERRLANRLIHKLESNTLLWYDVPIGRKQLHPDFIVLHPERGLLILEVKDWNLETVRKVTRTSVTICTENGIKEVDNPLEQARKYAHAVCKILERDAALVNSLVHPHRGKLSFPYSYGVVLSNISRKTFNEHSFGEVFNPNQVICKDEMTGQMDAKSFQEHLWGCFPFLFGNTLTDEQIKRIRWHLFPEIRIPFGEQLPLFPPETESEPDAAIPIQVESELLRLMDLQQEILARNFGEGHRVIHGVAGSGKTLILAYRCQYLAQQQPKPILVLCFNVALAEWLRRMIQDKELTAPVTIQHFHGWCASQLRNHKVIMPNRNKYKGEDYVQALVNCFIQAVDRGQIPKAQYGAVLIDEALDFEPEWLKLCTQMVDPETDSLVIAYDDAQKLYGENKGRKFSFSSVGIKARGRTSILKVNYRNTTEVLTLAYESAREVMHSSVVQD
ncbi:MAG: NERD domain-containing protein, partial [Cyanobacteriota bacterium]